MVDLRMLAVSEARPACRDEPDVIERVKKAMRVTKNHWLVTGEIAQIQSACAAAMFESPGSLNGEEAQLIARSCKSLVDLNNVLAAASMGAEGIPLPPVSVPEDGHISISTLWDSIK